MITAEDRGGNMTVPNVTRFDLNNNDLYPITQRKIKNAMQRKFLLQSKNQTCFKVQLINTVINTYINTHYVSNLIIM